MTKKLPNASEMGKKSAEVRAKKYGTALYSENGKKGGAANKAKGSEYFKRIRQIGIEKRRKQEEEANSPVNRFANLLTGKK